MSLSDRVGELLPLLNGAFPADLVAVLDRFLHDAVGATSVELLLADYDLRELRPLSTSAEDTLHTGAARSITESEPGRAYLAQAVVTIPHDRQLNAYVPVTLRDERLGVLGVALPQPVDAETLVGLEGVAIVLAYVLLAASRYTDLFEQARRRKPLSLEAEIQWSLQPVRAFGCTEFSLAGQLVPAYDVGGDSYDWVVNRSTASVSASDAMGHGLHASILGSLAVMAMRNARRGGASLTDRVAAADRAVYRQFGGAQFVTGVALEIDLATGTASAVNAGHPCPYRVRHGVIEHVELEAQLPMGLFEATEYVRQPLELRGGDRLVLVSDGVLEAVPPEGEEFGETRLEAAILATAGAPPHEAVRHLVRALLDYQQSELRDDATILMLDWRGPTAG
ncbi:MAG: hypothetical protein QOG64_2697 [Acidimicrobiaceae bacterium]|nr:hypothetical protein [Acidimicrobiaceae bacterium]